MLMIENIYQEVGKGMTVPYRAVINGEDYIIKSINNKEGYLSLFNDYVGNYLTNIFDLKTPDFGFCEFGDNSVSSIHTNFSINELFFYSKYINNPMYINDVALLKLIKNEDLIKLVVLDYLILNEDRNAENIFIIFDNQTESIELFPIDYTHSFPNGVLWEMGQMERIVKENNFMSFEEYMKLNYIHQMIMENIKFTKIEFEECTKRIYNRLSTLDIEGMINSVDDNILNRISVSDLESFKQFLNLRISNFQQLVEDVAILTKED